VSLIFAPFLMVAFLMLELHPVPLGCTPRGEHHDDGCD